MVDVMTVIAEAAVVVVVIAGPVVAVVVEIVGQVAAVEEVVVLVVAADKIRGTETKSKNKTLEINSRCYNRKDQSIEKGKRVASVRRLREVTPLLLVRML